VGILFTLTTLNVLWAVHDLPDPSQDVLAAGDVILLDRNGKLIENWSQAGHYHINVALQDMGPYPPAAVLAAEDRNFYSHGAIDPGSVARALWVDVTSGGLNEGGSTITQQLVKIQLLTPQKSVTRKVQELALAIVIEQRYSKDQILTMYLNRVYFGHGAYGIGAAAKTYFNKDVKSLTPAQAAFLAGLIQAPTAYDPVAHYDLAQQRVAEGVVALVVGGERIDGGRSTTHIADGFHRNHRGREPPLECLDNPLVVGAGPVDLVDEDQRRDAEPPESAEQERRLGLDAFDRRNHEDRAVEDTEDAFDLRDEVGMARRVDQVDREVAHEERGDRGPDRDPALALEIEGVGLGGAGVDAADVVDGAGGVEQLLAEGGLTGVDVGEDSEIERAHGASCLPRR